MTNLILKHSGTLLIVAFVALSACGKGPESDTGGDTSRATTGAPASAPSTASSATATDTAASAGAATPVAKVNLNTATEAEFSAIPGVGERMTHEFLEYRPYESIKQFRREIGKYVDEAQVAAYEKYVFVPIDPNTSDAETLQQLPGLDAAEAAQVVEGRPYASADAFVQKIASYVDGGSAAVSAYLKSK